MMPTLARAQAAPGDPKEELPPPTSAKDKPTGPKVDPLKGRWGNVAISLVERFGTIQLPSSAEHGKSGSLRGSGLELRFNMRPGIGAYYRLTTATTANNDKNDVYQLEWAFGFSKRLHATGKPGFWQFRTSSHLDFGFLYWHLDTNESCTRSYSPLSSSCETLDWSRGNNTSGSGVGLEARLGAEIAIGLLGLGFDVGVAGYQKWSTGGNSDSPPMNYWVPTAQLKLSVDLSMGE